MSGLLRPLGCQSLATTGPTPSRRNPQLACNSVRASSSSHQGTGTSVLDRPEYGQQQQQQQHGQQPADLYEDASAYEVLQEPSSGLAWEREFSDYSSATEMMNELESLQAELTSNASVMDSLWFAPTEVQEAPPAPRAPIDTAVCTYVFVFAFVDVL